jgi:hypothetical protein
MASHKHAHFLKAFGIFLILFLCFPGVMAVQTVSFADPDATVHKEIYMYNASGALLGTYNTTSNGIELPETGDILFTIKPTYSNPLDDPATFLDNLIGWLESNALSLIILAAMAGLLFKRW